MLRANEQATAPKLAAAIRRARIVAVTASRMTGIARMIKIETGAPIARRASRVGLRPRATSTA